jgi:hypothetical protein
MNMLTAGNFIPLARASQLKNKAVDPLRLAEIVIGCVGNCCLFNLDNTATFVG